MLTEEALCNALIQRKNNGNFRTLNVLTDGVDFLSNDYLGFARDPDLISYIQSIKEPHLGSTGSRLLSGHAAIFDEVEHQVARFHHAESGLIYNSGYDANIGFWSCVPQRGDTILYDQYVHASIRDGIRLSLADSFSFRHNIIDDLQKKLLNAHGNVFIALESVYSMDGDMPDLVKICRIANTYSAHVVVDEAHATGVVGQNGEGLVAHLDLGKSVFARIHTFGKAIGLHGAIILGSTLLREYLINFSKSFIYTTAMPAASIKSIGLAYSFLEQSADRIQLLNDKISLFTKAAVEFGIEQRIPSNTAIQSVLFPGNREVKLLAEHLNSARFLIKPIFHPTVPEGKERIRICLHAFNTESEITKLVRMLAEYQTHA